MTDEPQEPTPATPPVEAAAPEPVASPAEPVIPNASLIIERFGGIRPMAHKMNIPVTTVQGWKQRNAIPLNRRDDIVRAAAENRLDLGDLLLLMPAAYAKLEKPEPKKEEKSGRPPVWHDRFETHEPAENYKQTFFYAGIIIMAAAMIGSIFALAPKVRQLTDQEQKILQLQAELEAAKQAQEEQAAASLGSGITQSIADLQGKVTDLSNQAKMYSGMVDDLKTGTVQQRLSKLENNINQIAGQNGAMGLSAMLQKVQNLQQSPQGASALSGVIEQLLAQSDLGALSGSNGKSKEDLAAQLDKLRQDNPIVGDTLQDVPPEDMKAAAMLLAFAQLRQSLARDNASFDKDLELLKKSVAKDDPALLEAIERLAPRAKSGVLTPNGLSQEFRGLAGDIVAASLTGEDVKVQDRLKARLNDMVVVEKNGQQISGTNTQRTIAEAQRQLDAGNVEAAIAALQTLEGPAAQKSIPFIEQAQATVSAQKLQQLVGNNLIQQLKNPKNLANPQNMNSLIREIEMMMPGQGMYHDPKSGTTFMVPPRKLEIPKLELPHQPQR